jgi:hypothetical protein
MGPAPGLPGLRLRAGLPGLRPGAPGPQRTEHLEAQVKATANTTATLTDAPKSEMEIMQKLLKDTATKMALLWQNTKSKPKKTRQHWCRGADQKESGKYGI